MTLLLCIIQDANKSATWSMRDIRKFCKMKKLQIEKEEFPWQSEKLTEHIILGWSRIKTVFKIVLTKQRKKWVSAGTRTRTCLFRTPLRHRLCYEKLLTYFRLQQRHIVMWQNRNLNPALLLRNSCPKLTAMIPHLMIKNLAKID